MRATPRFFLISLAIPKQFDIDGFYRGVRQFHVAVAGGDLAR
jgi:thiamine monophosphate kinase